MMETNPIPLTMDTTAIFQMTKVSATAYGSYELIIATGEKVTGGHYNLCSVKHGELWQATNNNCRNGHQVSVRSYVRYPLQTNAFNCLQGKHCVSHMDVPTGAMRLVQLASAVRFSEEGYNEFVTELDKEGKLFRVLCVITNISL